MTCKRIVLSNEKSRRNLQRSLAAILIEPELSDVRIVSNRYLSKIIIQTNSILVEYFIWVIVFYMYSNNNTNNCLRVLNLMEILVQFLLLIYQITS